MPHYLNSIIDEDDDDEKINKRLIPYEYTFYKIFKDGCESYIGSTTNYYDRKVKHKSACNNLKSKKYNYPVYKYIRDNGGFDTFDVKVIATKFCNKRDAEIYEGELMKIHNSTLNVFRNYSEVDKKEYKKEYDKKQHKKYYEKYSEKIKQKNKEYRDNNPDKKKEYDKKYREKKKQEKQDINNITINIQNLTINLPKD